MIPIFMTKIHLSRDKLDHDSWTIHQGSEGPSQFLKDVRAQVSAAVLVTVPFMVDCPRAVRRGSLDI